MKKMIIFSLAASALFASNSYSTKSEWLMDTNTTQEKFKAIQTQFRGFDLAMVEVGYRFNSFYFAIQDKNYDLAQYQWDKIKKAIENGIIRRPKRAQNAKAMFLDTQYKTMSDALKSKDAKAVTKAYATTKKLCNTCHVAEKVPFIEVVDPEVRWQPIK